jgi:hypothetical protein
LTPPPPSRCAWDDAAIFALRRLWREFLPVRAIARDLGRRPGQVQAMVRQLDLAHRDPAGVARAERLRAIGAALRRAREAEEEMFPVHITVREAAELAALHKVAWSGRQGDLKPLNDALDLVGKRPVHVPFRDLRP